MTISTRAIIVAAEQKVDALCRSGIDPRAARRAVRIEATHDATYDIIGDADYHYRQELMPKQGPRQLHGIDLYTVYDLPEPGWRIVDPFA